MKQTITLVLISIILLLHIKRAEAQMVGPYTFLQGRYLEVGIGPLGFFGADTSVPAGYHPHCPFPCEFPDGLGFVADPGMDGWTVGTPPMMGDYFLPGSPYEGWEIQENGKRCQAFNISTLCPFMYSGGMPHATMANTISYSTTGGLISSTWRGEIDSMSIFQVTTLDTNSLYFTVKVTFTNNAIVPKNDLYYLRTLDPDNDATWPGGDHRTHNLIEHQMPGAAHASLVSATGYSSTAPYLGLGTTDTASRAVIYLSWVLDSMQDLGAIYNETYIGAQAYYSEGTVHDSDFAIGIIEHIPHLAGVDSAGDSVLRVTAGSTLHPANSATITFFYAFSRDAADSAMSYLNPAPTSVQNVSTVAPIKAYPNPTSGTVTIIGLTNTDQLSLYDIMGRQVMQTKQAAQQGSNTISLSTLSPGAYILIVTDANGHMRDRIPLKKL